MLNFIGENECPSKKAKQMTPILVLPIFNLYSIGSPCICLLALIVNL